MHEQYKMQFQMPLLMLKAAIPHSQQRRPPSPPRTLPPDTTIPTTPLPVPLIHMHTSPTESLQTLISSGTREPSLGEPENVGHRRATPTSGRAVGMHVGCLCSARARAHGMPTGRAIVLSACASAPVESRTRPLADCSTRSSGGQGQPSPAWMA